MDDRLLAMMAIRWHNSPESDDCCCCCCCIARLSLVRIEDCRNYHGGSDRAGAEEMRNRNGDRDGGSGHGAGWTDAIRDGAIALRVSLELASLR